LHNSTKDTISGARTRVKDKNLRVERIDKISSKIASELEKREEIARLEKQRQMLSATVKKN
jgi:hypothetical protein